MMKYLILILLFTSCSFYKNSHPLINYDAEKLLDSVQLTGEGKGRLTLGQSKYLFGVESVLNENYDWILAVSLPIHGEETLILRDIKKKDVNNQEQGSFELRIKNELEHLELSHFIEPETFINELRSLIRFNLARYWDQKRACRKVSSDLICKFDGDEFHVTVNRKELIINKYFSKSGIIQLSAKNFSDSLFNRTDILFYRSQNELDKKESGFSLELFW